MFSLDDKRSQVKGGNSTGFQPRIQHLAVLFLTIFTGSKVRINGRKLRRFFEA